MFCTNVLYKLKICEKEGFSPIKDLNEKTIYRCYLHEYHFVNYVQHFTSKDKEQKSLFKIHFSTLNDLRCYSFYVYCEKSDLSVALHNAKAIYESLHSNQTNVFLREKNGFDEKTFRDAHDFLVAKSDFLINLVYKF